MRDFGNTGTNPAANWTAVPPAGITVSPASGSLAVPTGGSASATLTVSAAAGTASGNDSLPITLAAADGRTLPTVTLSMTIGQPGSLFALYNSTGVSDDGNRTAVGNFDGAGNSFSEQALVAAGVSPGGSVTAAGFAFPWADFPVAQPDNIQAGSAGLTVDMSATPASATALSVLGIGLNGNATGTLTLTYTDGSTQQASIVLADWTLGGGSSSVPAGDTVAVQLPYRNNTTGWRADRHRPVRHRPDSAPARQAPGEGHPARHGVRRPAARLLPRHPLTRGPRSCRPAHTTLAAA